MKGTEKVEMLFIVSKSYYDLF